ncbi:MAG: FAD-dependent oxidoreductase, partial [Acidobacteriota bacterium]|nr:FAD-dependent oxidoreductase [Acidobacteriota bacterium]
MQTDTLIIGCGIAGATAALRLAEDRERQITIVTREGDPAESNSSYAQGGIASRGADDSTELLVEDVLRAGAGLSWPPAVELLAESGPRLVEELFVAEGEPDFDRGADGALVYGL